MAPAMLTLSNADPARRPDMTTAVIDEVQDKALLAVPERPPSPPAAMMVEVARKYGVSPLRQMRESFGLAMGKQRFHLHHIGK